MKPKLTIEDIEILLKTMKKAQVEHTKANIKYDTERNEVLITYPLPNDFMQVQAFGKIINN